MFILGSCKALDLREPGCCVAMRTQSCISLDCHCDQNCYSNNDCCDDINDISCYPVSSFSLIVLHTPTDTLGKTKSKDHTIH